MVRAGVGERDRGGRPAGTVGNLGARRQDQGHRGRAGRDLVVDLPGRAAEERARAAQRGVRARLRQARAPDREVAAEVRVAAVGRGGADDAVGEWPQECLAGGGRGGEGLAGIGPGGARAVEDHPERPARTRPLLTVEVRRHLDGEDVAGVGVLALRPDQGVLGGLAVPVEAEVVAVDLGAVGRSRLRAQALLAERRERVAHLAVGDGDQLGALGRVRDGTGPHVDVAAGAVLGVQVHHADLDRQLAGEQRVRGGRGARARELGGTAAVLARRRSGRAPAPAHGEQGDGEDREDHRSARTHGRPPFAPTRAGGTRLGLLGRVRYQGSAFCPGRARRGSDTRRYRNSSLDDPDVMGCPTRHRCGPAPRRGGTMGEQGLDRSEFFIGGRWVGPAGSETLEVVSPHTEQVVATVPRATTADLDAAVAAARDAFDRGPWPRMAPAQRIEAVERFAGAYAARMGEMADLITLEMGCPSSFANLGQVPAAWMQAEAFLTIARAFGWEEARPGALGGDVIVRREPVGVVAAIAPWNVPQFTALSKLLPALLAGCTVVLKPAEETPLDAYLLAEILAEAGIPEGVVSVVPGGREVGAHLVRHPEVDKVAFTGSTVVGREIGSVCGEQLKRVSLELGGKSAAIVLADADLEVTMAGLGFTGLMNSGQACVAQTRVLAPHSIYGEVVDALAATVSAMPVGDPADPATQIGPMVSRRQQERVAGYIALGPTEGARVVTGGDGMPDGLDRGWYVRPTVFADVDNRMRIAQEEIFGPVLCVIPYDDVDDAVRIANDSDYGLAGTVWTTDVDAGVDVARRVRTGTYGVNTYTMDFAAPFGGFKTSGIGREFGPEGLAGYTELKSVYLPGPAQEG